MIVTCVYVHVRPEMINDFIEATRINHAETMKESGSLRFDFLREAEDQTRFMIYEVFDSKESVDAHKISNHYLSWRDTVAGMMAEPRKGVRYAVVEPADVSAW